MSSPAFALDNSYARELAGLYSDWQPEPAAEPSLLYVNRDLAHSLGIQGLSALENEAGALARLFGGNDLPVGAQPIAQAYAGHQFGQFSPQLGDGRALLLGELVDRSGQRRDVAFKGSGRTPFSRGGDGKAAVGPMLRELIIGEAMHGLGIPTTRALAVVATGSPVFREKPLPGAVLTRIAASHIRVGTFEFFAARRLTDELRRLADFAIARHDASLVGSDDAYLGFFKAVAQRQARLIARWMQAGFIHGVMNTDNMAISGETIDYGPCAFMEAYNPLAVFSSIDLHGRYAYGNQPGIAQWNLARLAETLVPLMGDEDAAVTALSECLEAFLSDYDSHWLAGMRGKLGLAGEGGDPLLQQDAEDAQLADAWLNLLHENQVDFTLAWRYLADAAQDRPERLRALFTRQDSLDQWLARWRARCQLTDAAQGLDGHQAGVERALRMNAVNPWIIARNHRVEEALSAASDASDLKPLHRLLDALKTPFTETPDFADLAEPASPASAACYKTFCGT
jgi:uncharacterized protein YdiU (UPF0061 family)